MNERDIIRQRRGGAYVITCRKRLWSVIAPTQQQAEREARNYWIQYNADGEYNNEP